MNCPNCKETKLVLSERQGIEIDYCPECRGIWLDRGELDKILERAQTAGHTEDRPPQRPEPDRRDYAPDPYARGDYYGHGKYHKRKKSFLEELFD